MMTGKQRKIFFICLILLVCLLCWCFVIYSPKCGASSPGHAVTSTETTLSERTDTIEYLPQGGGDLVRHTYYVLSFNDRHKQANWVYYQLDLRNCKPIAERSNNFREDKLVTTLSAKPSDYAKSGYDRGHLCPAADMAISDVAMSETFYMSNMSPQVPAFNRGIWKSLEERVRSWGMEEKILVAVGPVFKDGKGTIGRSRVTVPGYYYKVVYSPGRQKMIAFVLPNEKGRKSLKQYIVSVDSVENLTDINFFPQLPDSLQNRLEVYSDSCAWKWK